MLNIIKRVILYGTAVFIITIMVIMNANAKKNFYLNCEDIWYKNVYEYKKENSRGDDYVATFDDIREWQFKQNKNILYCKSEYLVHRYVDPETNWDWTKDYGHLFVAIYDDGTVKTIYAEHICDGTKEVMES